MAFGAPSAPGSLVLDNIIYAGTSGGHIYVTFTGGGVGTPWTDISAGLDGSGVSAIVTNPTFAAAMRRMPLPLLATVYHMVDSSAPGATWVKITGNLFSASLTRTLYNDPQPQLRPRSNT